MEMEETGEAVPGRTKRRLKRRVCGEIEVEVLVGGGGRREREVSATGELEEMKARV